MSPLPNRNGTEGRATLSCSIKSRLCRIRIVLIELYAGTLHKMLAVPIHTAACAAGVGAGIAGGVATGPV